MVLLMRRAVLQAVVETSYGDASALGLNDGILVSEPAYTIDPNVLERDIVTPDLSPEALIIGRKLSKMTFKTELRSNGKTNSGLLADAPVLSRLFRACGYAVTASAAPSAHGVFDQGSHANVVTWAKDAATATNTNVIAYYLKVTTAGASGVAAITVTSDTAGEGSASQVVTTATQISLGTKGLKVTPTFTGNLALGQTWVVWLLPAGLRLDPVSDNFESVHLGMNKDGVFHSMPGSFGTFEVTAEAGKFASISWTFTGKFVDPVDAVMVSPNYEKTLPHQVELARLRINDFNAIVAKFTFNQGNEINIRPDVSSKDGYIGTRMTARKPEGGIDPEAELVATYDFWGKLASAERMPFQMRVGIDPGNTVWMFAPSTQYTGLTYQDRDGILNYDAGLRFSRVNGNDEMLFFLC